MATQDLAKLLTSPAQEPPWVVHGIIPRGSFTILAGDAGVGKSSLCYALAMAVASGRPFLGHRTEQLPVLYFDEENSRYDFAQYVHWAWHGADQPPIDELVPNLRLEHMSLVRDWRAQMEPIVKEYRPALVFIDTVTSALDIQDENSNAEAGQVLRGLRRVQDSAENDTAFVLLKHSKTVTRSEGDGEEPQRTIRGAKLWIGSTDLTLFYHREKGRPSKGLWKATLSPDKSRAFGLKYDVSVFPERTAKGLILRGKTDDFRQPIE